MTSKKGKVQTAGSKIFRWFRTAGSKISRWFEYVDKFIPFVLIVTCVGVARFVDLGVLVFAVFILTLGVYAWRKYDSRMLVGTALFLLVACAALLTSGREDYANDVAVWAYYFLVIGVLGLFIEYLREKA